MDYSPILTALLALATAFIAYTGVIQKEREHGRERPLFATRVRASIDGGLEFVATNVGGQPALGVLLSGCGSHCRTDVLEPGEELVVRATFEQMVEVVIRYRGLSRPYRMSVRRFEKQGETYAFVDGYDQARGVLNRFRVNLCRA